MSKKRVLKLIFNVHHVHTEESKLAPLLIMTAEKYGVWTTGTVTEILHNKNQDSR